MPAAAAATHADLTATRCRNDGRNHLNDYEYYARGWHCCFVCAASSTASPHPHYCKTACQHNNYYDCDDTYD